MTTKENKSKQIKINQNNQKRFKIINKCVNERNKKKKKRKKKELGKKRRKKTNSDIVTVTDTHTPSPAHPRAPLGAPPKGIGCLLRRQTGGVGWVGWRLFLGWFFWGCWWP